MGHHGHEHHLLGQIWNRSEWLMVLETPRQCTNRTPRHFSAHSNLFLPLSDAAGEPRAPLALLAQCGEHPRCCSQQCLCPVRLLLCAVLPHFPGDSAGKRQETDAVLICAQLIVTTISTPSAVPQLMAGLWEGCCSQAQLAPPAGPSRYPGPFLCCLPVCWGAEQVLGGLPARQCLNELRHFWNSGDKFFKRTRNLFFLLTVA